MAGFMLGLWSGAFPFWVESSNCEGPVFGPWAVPIGFLGAEIERISLKNISGGWILTGPRCALGVATICD